MATKSASALIALTIIAWLALYYEAIASAASIWYTSEIFTHGFFVVPGALWIIWTKRAELAATERSPNYWVALLLVPVILLGVVGKAGQINLFSHIACFASLPLAIWMVIGNRQAALIWFPLAFMLFSIPVGEELVPVLQQWTAKLAILLMGLTSIPVFVDGLYIEIPAGRFVVAEACSGIRFFVGSIVFGVVYAYFSFSSTRFRLAFVVLSVIVPILANALRVFGLVIIGHYFGMEHASGTDHLVYGWVFFALVLGLLFFGGELLRKFERPTYTEPKISSDTDESLNQVIALKPLVIVFAMFVVSGFWTAALSNNDTQNEEALSFESFVSVNNVEMQDGWQPIVFGESERAILNLIGGVTARVYWFAADREGSELTDYRNRLFDKDRWSIVSQAKRVQGEQRYVETILTTVTGKKRLIASWFVLETGDEVRGAVSKIKQTMSRLVGGTGAGAWVMFSMPFREGQLGTAQQAMSDALDRYAQPIKQGLPL